MANSVWPRAVGAAAISSAVLFVAAGVADASGVAWAGLVRASSLLALLPAVVHLARSLGPRAPLVVGAASAAGALSLAMWAAAGALLPWRLEAAWIALSAVWWLGVGVPLRHVRSRLGTFTVVLGVAAALDAVVTAAPGVPFWAYAALGGWKIPLSLAWSVWLGATLLRRGADALWGPQVGRSPR